MRYPWSEDTLKKFRELAQIHTQFSMIEQVSFYVDQSTTHVDPVVQQFVAAEMSADLLKQIYQPLKLIKLIVR